MSAAPSIPKLISKTVAALKAPSTESGKVVHLALSGGVDSSVAGFLLRERGWDVRPVLMRCWSDGDDGAEAPCFERELQAAESATKSLRLKRPLSVFDFVPEYWNDVFNGVLLSGLAAGITPNQDLACNKFIKFGAFPQRLAQECGSHMPPPFATGHYARLEKSRALGNCTEKLLRATDEVKDQTYFLASVPGAAFRNAIFPIGSLHKSDVRRIAVHAGLPAANDRSSRGICFVGKRTMSDFISRYLGEELCKTGDREDEAPDGSFVLRGKPIAPLTKPALLYTIGERARVGGAPGRLYVVGREGSSILLSASLPVTRRLTCRVPHWVSGVGPEGLKEGRELEYKGCSSAKLASCRAILQDDGLLGIAFSSCRPAVAPGQIVVLYDGENVLGSTAVEYCHIEDGQELDSTPTDMSQLRV